MKNGKLFGKLNIIDLIIILIVIAGIIFLAVRFLDKEETVYDAPQRVRMTFFADTAPALLEGKLLEGDPVTDFDESNWLGNISSCEVAEAYEWQYDSASGTAVKIPVANSIALTFSCDCDGYPAADGLRVNSHRYCIGGTYVICAGRTRVSCRLADFEVIG